MSNLTILTCALQLLTIVVAGCDVILEPSNDATVTVSYSALFTQPIYELTVFSTGEGPGFPYIQAVQAANLGGCSFTYNQGKHIYE